MNIQTLNQTIKTLEGLRNAVGSFTRADVDLTLGLLRREVEAPAEQLVIECDCETATSPDGSRLTKCGSDQMRRAVQEGHAFCKQPAQQEPVQRYSPDGEGGMEIDSLGAWVKFTSPQPAQQEPVAWVEGEEIYWHNAPDLNDWIRQNGRPLVYGDTSPQPAQRKPLTDEEIDELADQHPAYLGSVYPHAFARAIEAAHGIKGDA